MHCEFKLASLDQRQIRCCIGEALRWYEGCTWRSGRQIGWIEHQPGRYSALKSQTSGRNFPNSNATNHRPDEAVRRSGFLVSLSALPLQ
jgi:hypothetical protein